MTTKENEMNEKPSPIELADALDANADLDAAEGGNPAVCKLEWDAATMLRTQHAAIERLTRIEAAWSEWQYKTEWAQESAQPKELGMHRADVLKARIERKDALLRQALDLIYEAQTYTGSASRSPSMTKDLRALHLAITSELAE